MFDIGKIVIFLMFVIFQTLDYFFLFNQKKEKKNYNSFKINIFSSI